MTRWIRLTLATAAILAATAALAQSDAQKSFSQLKSLSGSWEGKSSDGKPVKVSFRETSAGSALMSEIIGHMDMITMFHFDGPNSLLLTHYCGMGNQPRMRADASPDGKSITFNFVDATNLATPDAGHMQRVVFSVLDANHHTEEWVFLDHGKELRQVFDLNRKM
jgi:hypothetical protein